VHATQGRLAEAIAETRKSAELDPLSTTAWSTLGRMYYSAGRYAEAREALERSLHITPEQNYAASHLAIVALLEKHPAEALAYAERSASDLFRLHGKVLALHDSGRIEEARRGLDEMIARFAHSGAYQIAETYAWFGDRD